MKRLKVASFIIACLVLFMAAIPVVAATFEAIITIIESDGTSYDMLGMSANVNIPEMATSGYITVTGRDVQIMRGATELPRMLTDDTTAGRGACLADAVTGGSSTAYTFETGNTLADFSIIPLYGGYFTVADNATIELSDNFSVQWNDAWIDTTAGADKNLFEHQDDANGGIVCYVSPAVSENVTVDIITRAAGDSSAFRPNAAGDLTELTPSAGTNYACSGDNDDATYVGEVGGTFKSDLYHIPDHTTEAGTINSVTVYFRIRINAIVEGAYAKPLWKIDGNIHAGTQQASVTTAWATKSQVYAVSPETSAAWTWDELDGAQFGVQLKTDGGAASAQSADVWYIVNYQAPTTAASVTVTGISSGEYDITLSGEPSLDFVRTSSDYVTIPDADNFSFIDGVGNDVPCTIIVWAKLDDATGSAFLSKGLVAGDKQEWLFGTGSADEILWFTLWNPDGTLRIARAIDNIAAYEGLWTHYAVTYDGNELVGGINLYINGADSDTTSSTAGVYAGMTNSNRELEMGSKQSGSASYLDGELAEVKIYYDRELTPEEILADFNGTHSPANLEAWYRLDEGVGNPTDSSGNGHNATVNLADWTSGILRLTVGVTFGVTDFPSVPDSTANWTFMKNDTNDFFPYAGNITMEINGVLQAWYQPEDIIAGDILPDRQGTAQDGTFTWGSNPSGISAEFSSMELVEEPAAVAVGLVTPDALGIVDITEPIHKADVDLRMPAHELYPIVRDVASLSNITEEMIWWFISALLALAALTVSRKYTNSTLLAGFCCCAVMAMFVSMAGGCLEWWMPAVVFLATLTTVIWNKTSSL